MADFSASRMGALLAACCLVLIPEAWAQSEADPPPGTAPRDVFFVALDEKRIGLSANVSHGSAEAVVFKFTRPPVPELCPTVCFTGPLVADLRYTGPDFPVAFVPRLDSHVEVTWSYKGTVPGVAGSLNYRVAQLSMSLEANGNQFFGPFMDLTSQGGTKTSTAPFTHNYGAGQPGSRGGMPPRPTEPPKNFTASQMQVTLRIDFAEPPYAALLDREVEVRFKTDATARFTVHEMGAAVSPATTIVGQAQPAATPGAQQGGQETPVPGLLGIVGAIGAAILLGRR